MKDLADRVWRKLRERRFLAACRSVIDTPPCAVDPGDRVVVFSMIGTRVLLPYLVAAKSFQSRLGRGRFVILDDGTLTADDRAVLAHHLGDPPVLAIDAVDTGDCPRGGTWERLLTILDQRRDHYVIQLDSDTVTLGPVPEINAAIDAGRSFTLRGEEASEMRPLTAIAAEARRHGEAGRPHVQLALERTIDQVTVPGRADLHYVRGCSGFAGFAPSSEGRQLAEAFSRAGERLLGRKRWEEWGTEQVTSNFVIANQPDALLLPYDRYLNFWNTPIPAGAAFVHFIGTYRYHRDAYRQAALAAIAALRR